MNIMQRNTRCTNPFLFFFFNDTATTEIYTLSLHDALPICSPASKNRGLELSLNVSPTRRARDGATDGRMTVRRRSARSEEYTSELQSQSNLVCRLLLEKKK